MCRTVEALRRGCNPFVRTGFSPARAVQPVPVDRQRGGFLHHHRSLRGGLCVSFYSGGSDDTNTD